MVSFSLITKSQLFVVLPALSTALTYAIPPYNASAHKLAADPVSVSIEFFTWPDYNTLPGTLGCLGNLKDVIGQWPGIRIGGTTQDRALYDPTLNKTVNYTVANLAAAPLSLTYGPSYIDLVGKYPGNVTLGLNRELAQQNNTILAAQTTLSHTTNIYAFELGNEPDLYGSSSPIAKAEENGVWTPATDADNQVHWQSSVSAALNRSSIIQAGVRISSNWNVAQLAPVEVSSGSLQYVRSFGAHQYPQSACGGQATYLNTLMSHTSVINSVSRFQAEANVAHGVGKPFLLSETNSATCGGGGISSTFGAALWIVDYVLRSMVLGVDRMNFHQGTVGNSPYSWWGADITGVALGDLASAKRYTYAPFYGAYFASAALANAGTVAMLDAGNTAMAAYAIYGKDGRLMRAVLYNSAYFNGTGTRGSANYTLTGLPANSLGLAVARRLTSAAATDKVELGQVPNFGGVQFDNLSCAKMGSAVHETVSVVGGSASFSVKDSEALLVDFV